MTEPTGKDTTALRVAPLVVWGSLFVAWALLVAPGLLTYAFGSPTTATVQRCEVDVTTNNEGSTSSETTCYGSWPIGARTGEGRIEGGGQLREGSRVDVRGTAWAAATQEVPGRSLQLSAFGIGLGVITHGICWWVFSRQSGGTKTRSG